MDTSTFIDRLNEDLGTEYQSIVQYIQHIATIKGPEYHSITEELGNHLGQELQHAKILAQQIDFLGGTPTVKVPDVPDASDGASALKADVELEQRQLDRYRQRVMEANELGLPDVAEVLRPLLQQTQDHVRELQIRTRRLKALASNQASGLRGWRPEPPGKRVGQAGAVGAVPHPGDIAVGPDQHGTRIGNRAKYRKLPIAIIFRVDHLAPDPPMA